MSSGSAWDTAAWRDVGRRSQYDQPRPLPISAPTAVNPATQSAILDHYARDSHTWSHERRSSLAEPHNEATYYSNGSHERHTPAPGGKHGPQQLTDTSPHHALPAWRSLQADDRRGSTSTMTADAPLTLHIPQSQGDGMEDLPRLSPAYAVVKTEGQSYHQGVHTPSQQAPSLPSFASFQEHATRPNDADVDGPEIAPMAARLSCYLCSKLNPMVREVAIAAAELDENVQTYCNKAVIRKTDFPVDSPVRTAQWVLERLGTAKQNMLDAARRVQQPAYFFPHPPAPTGMLSRPGSPGSSLKRQAGWESNDYPASKRVRSGDSPEFGPSSAIYDRRASIDFPPRNMYSPQAIGSAPHSAYPRTASPSLAGRGLRPLPSPSSLAYPQSAAPSLNPPTGHPGSPALSYQASASIHTASTNSVTSAHIADLQHQVTLKSLSLQTLQSEYSGLLQKLQRERVKSQTIEKKTTVSEQEVNDLTGRNEELTEQVKNLEQQLEDSEKKRESERAEGAKEKEQWSRMLDMSSRLQGKLAVERQNLVEERDALKRRAMGLESEVKGRSRSPVTFRGNVAATLPSSSSVEQPQTLPVTLIAGSDVTDLNREISQLKAKIKDLTLALQEAQRKTGELSEHSRGVLRKSSEVAQTINKALGTVKSPSPEQGNAVPDSNTRGPAPIALLPGAQPSSFRTGPPIVVSTAKSPPKLAVKSRPGLPTPTSATGPSMAEMTSAGRAVSPGPEELGINVQHSTSSPEELVKALGPAPAPLPTFQFQASTYAPVYSAARRQSVSPPEAHHSYTHASPYRHVQSPYTTQHGHIGRPGASPPSDHGSMGSAHDRDSPPQQNPVSKRRSSETFIASRPSEDSRSFPGARLMHMEPQRKVSNISNAAPPGLASFRQWNYDTRSEMPPPPRPSASAQPVQTGQFSSV
ncbi:hypothetical protein LTR97_005498 [Elasticomyces elasticus]|uniref:Uncharacterized protein n=1 Tax=Elasticomyces elasticus TaxID=574655 RepID=A0AAN7ZNW0_9PEZI|nr:hypothetical protein LTR97_005498 [Elasticomyces elasticus]